MMESEKTEGFANQGSKLMLVFDDDVHTVVHSTRDVGEVFSQLEEKASNLDLRVNEEKHCSNQESKTSNQAEYIPY